MRAVGIDFGAVYLKGVLLDAGNLAPCRLYRRKGFDDFGALADFLKEIAAAYPGEKFRLGITGLPLGGEKSVTVNAIMAVASSAAVIGFNGINIVEIGGQSSRLIVLREPGGSAVREFSLNDVCAAGSGMFIEQQAGRLQMSLDEFSRHSASGARPVAIAGRCAVFAKSDMIHLQQKGVEVGPLAFGLCKAIVRNCEALLLKGHELARPMMIAGGCAANGGIVRAFAEMPGFDASDSIFVSPYPGLEGAIGAANLACNGIGDVYTCLEIEEIVRSLCARSHKEPGILPPLKRKQHAGPGEPEGDVDQPAAGYLGVDVGSVSTDIAVLDAAGNLISSVYLPTRGRPIEALRQGLAILHGRFKKGLKILGCGTTGSGRHLAGRILGADIVKNEITCQYLGVRHFISDIDTIFEIGGQDSKFISVAGDSIRDFLMNKVCAAGTGSFLEEQAAEMGIDIFSEFADLAFASTAPVDLGSHCTVFMETEIVAAMQRGMPVADICAGLTYSIARNYLEKVVGSRPIGKKIAFQGGVASNAAVVAAFEQILGQSLLIMPYNRISGAIGAAVAARSHMAGRSSMFRGFDCTQDASIRTFQCGLCSNNCEVSIIEQGGEKIYYGDTCERYTSGGGKTPVECPLPNLAAEFIVAGENYFRGHEPGPIIIGIPRASTMVGYLPFWATFFLETGCTPMLSECTDDKTMALGLKHMPASVCLPVKLMAGHVAALNEMKPEYIFLPSIMHLSGTDSEHSFACPYAMALPFMINLHSPVRVLSPVISLNDENSFVEGMADCMRVLCISEARLREAFRKARLEQAAFIERMKQRAAELISGLSYRYVFGVIGKPYNLFDPYLNLGLFERLRRLGVLAVPLPMLSLIPEIEGCLLPWEFSAEIFRAARACVFHDGIYPLLTSNYGCALDSFTFRQLEPHLVQKPHLIAEFDEHRGEVGLITRLEAFLDQLDGAKKVSTPVPAPPVRMNPVALVPETGARICMPYWSDYVYAYAGIWQHRGYDVEILPVPDKSVRQLGERYSPGKECSPYTMVVGDLIRLHQDRPSEKLVYHFPGVTFPCLLTQYGNSMQLLISNLGIDHIRLSSLNGTELAGAFGFADMQLLYESLLAIDVLVKAACEIRPYEKIPGMTSDLHHRNLMCIREGVARGSVIQALDTSLKLLSTVPVDRSRKKPLIGIAGDLYTKVNEAANSNLFSWLEEQGFEVWPSPSQIDLLDYGIASSFLQSLSRFEPAGILTNGAIALRALLGAWKIRWATGNRIVHFDEPGYRDIVRLTRPYMSNLQYELLLTNIAKIVDFVERGADGVINATCFNCMVGNASTAIIEKIRRDHEKTPIITAVFDGTENPGRQLQLEAFACQVREHFANDR